MFTGNAKDVSVTVTVAFIHCLISYRDNIIAIDISSIFCINPTFCIVSAYSKTTMPIASWCSKYYKTRAERKRPCN